MSVFPHTLAIFQRPKEGNGFQRRCIALNYQHSIVAQGWYDTASCDIAVRSQTEGQDYLNNYLGCRVHVYVDNPYEPAWEGFINRLTFNTGGASFSISLDEMANRVSVVYTAAANAETQTAVVNSTTSQNLYGVKQDQIEMGSNASGTTGHPNALRDTILAQRAFPQTSITQGQGNASLVHMEMLGFYHTLKWEKRQTGLSAATGAFDANIQVYIGALANATTFFDNTDLTGIAANATLASNQQRSQSYWDIILKIAEAGDGTNYFITGIEPINLQTGKRRFYYRKQTVTTLYTARQKDGLRIRDLYGRIVPPWTVRPDRTIMVTDVLVGYQANVATDPRLTYLFTVNYDANSQQVQWMGADDTTANGAWMLRRGFKPFGRSFGAGLRTMVT